MDNKPAQAPDSTSTMPQVLFSGTSTFSFRTLHLSHLSIPLIAPRTLSVTQTASLLEMPNSLKIEGTSMMIVRPKYPRRGVLRNAELISVPRRLHPSGFRPQSHTDLQRIRSSSSVHLLCVLSGITPRLSSSHQAISSCTPPLEGPPGPSISLLTIGFTALLSSTDERSFRTLSPAILLVTGHSYFASPPRQPACHSGPP